MKKLIVLLAVAPAFAFASGAWAADATNNLTVDATVLPDCSVTSGAIHFGDYNPITTSSDTSASGLFTVYCTKGTAVHVGMGEGANYSAGRRMKNGTANFLSYGLFMEGSHVNVWNDSVDDRKAIASTAGTGGNELNVYGLLPKNQDQPAGEYSDTVAINVWIDA
jgi:spore coat protein U-like protein